MVTSSSETKMRRKSTADAMNMRPAQVKSGRL